MLKRNYIAMLLLLMAGLVGCSKGEDSAAPVPDPEGEELSISFGAKSADEKSAASAASAGRADLVEGSNSALFRSKPFSVYADWIMPDANQTRVEVFRDQQVTYEASSNTPAGWTYDPLKAWEYAGNYDFRAYWPATVKTMGTASARNLAIEYSTLTNDEDLMVAYTHCATRNEGRPVELRFRHTLAAVAVKFRTQQAGMTCRVKNFFFTSLNYLGALGYYDTDPAIDLTTRWFFADGARAAVNGENILLSQRLREWSSSAGVALTTSADDFPEEFALFPPQALKVEGDTPKPSITFTVDIVWDDTDTITTTVALPTLDSKGEEMVWRAGKKYVYVITVEADRFEITVETSDWDDVKAVTGDIHI